MIDAIKNEVDLHFELKINFISESHDQQGQVAYSFGVGKLPTKEEVNAVIEECREMFNSSIGSKDARLVNLEDFGFASPANFGWKD